MLQAEIHGHRVEEAQGSEDYLVSAVFGHLRYLKPQIFWNHLFRRAVSLPVNSKISILDGLIEQVRGAASQSAAVV